jgi:hypothetical protein
MVRTERNMKKTLSILMALASLTIATHVQAYTWSLKGVYGWGPEDTESRFSYRWMSYSPDGSVIYTGIFNPKGFTYTYYYPPEKDGWP